MSLTPSRALYCVALGAGAVALGDLGHSPLRQPRVCYDGDVDHVRPPPPPERLRRHGRGPHRGSSSATLRPGSSVDLGGEVIVGNDVDTVPGGVTVQNGTSSGRRTSGTPTV